MLRHLRLSMGISSLSPSKILPLQKNKHLELAEAAGLLDLDRVLQGVHLLQILGSWSPVLR